MTPGGGILSGGELSLTECTVSHNSINHYGGGVGVGGPTTITNSNILNNQAGYDGGGLNCSSYDTLTIVNSTIAGNVAGRSGGALRTANATVLLDRCTVSDNRASSGGGGLSHQSGNMTIVDSAISGNQVTGGDGGGIGTADELTMTRCTVSGNTADDGGGILIVRGTLTIEDSTISGNQAVDAGGGIVNSDTSDGLVIRRSTITQNRAGRSGGIYSTTNVPSVDHAIIAENSSTDASNDLSGTYLSLGNNLIGDLGTATGFTNGLNGDLVGDAASPVDPMLGPLQDNGGTTLTHAPLAGSPVIDAGDNIGASSLDQRGAARVLDGDLDGTWTVDIGAVEYFDGFWVDSLDDTVDDNPGDGVAADASGNTTLRAAVMEANALAGHQTIVVRPGTYVLTIVGLDEDGAQTGDLDVSEDVTIAGADAATTIIDAGTTGDRLFEMVIGIGTLRLRGLKITGGDATGSAMASGGADLRPQPVERCRMRVYRQSCRQGRRDRGEKSLCCWLRLLQQ